MSNIAQVFQQRPLPLGHDAWGPSSRCTFAATWLGLPLLPIMHACNFLCLRSCCCSFDGSPSNPTFLPFIFLSHLLLINWTRIGCRCCHVQSNLGLYAGLATSFFFCNIPSLFFLPLLLCPLGGTKTLTSWRDPSLLNWTERTRIRGFYPLLQFSLIVFVASTIVSHSWDWNPNFLMRLISTQLDRDCRCRCYLDSNMEFLCCLDLW